MYEGYKHLHTYFRFIFNLHAGKDTTTNLLKPLHDVQYSKRKD